MCLSSLRQKFEFLLRISLAGLFLFITHPTAVLAQVQTGYIDDQYGDPRSPVLPLYSGSGRDIDWLQGANCSDCGMAFSGLDVQQAFNQTWHWTEFLGTDVPRTVTLGFTGTSLNVYCILPNNPVTPIDDVSNHFSSDAPIISNYNLTFTLDTLPVNHTFTHMSDGSGQFQYNVSVLSLSGLSQIQHTLVMSAPTHMNSTILFDYATYEFSLEASSSSSTSKHSNVAAIAGGISGGICLLVILGALYYYRRVRQRRIRAGEVEGKSLEPSPFHPMRSVPFVNSQIHGSQVDSNAPSTLTRSIHNSIRKPPLWMQNSITPESIHGGWESSEHEAISQLRSNLESLQHEFRSHILPPTYDAV